MVLAALAVKSLLARLLVAGVTFFAIRSGPGGLCNICKYELE